MMNRRDVLDAILDQSEHAEELSNAPGTYNEDRAFMNRMKAVRFRNMEEADLRRLWQIELRGLDVRLRLDKAIRASKKTIYDGLTNDMSVEEVVIELERISGEHDTK